MNKQQLNKLLGPAPPLLTAVELEDRIHRFNASKPYNWSIFDDVPPVQHANVMCPFELQLFNMG